MIIVGYKEPVHIVICGDDYEFTATMDTGNGGVAPTLGAEDVVVEGDDVSFTIRGKRYTLPRKGEAAPTVGNVIHHRPLVLVDEIRIGDAVLKEVYLAIDGDRHKSTESLMNRDLMSRMGIVVDPSKNNLSSL